MTEFLIGRFIKDAQRVRDGTVRQQYGLLSGVTGIVLNLSLAAAKCLAGLLSGSIAIMADAANNLSDAVSGIVTLVGFRLAAQKADSGHPFGHGRIEYLAGLLVSALIMLVGFELGRSSVGKIMNPEPVQLTAATAVILAVSVLVKLWLGRFNRTLGKKLQSAAMSAVATDAMSDAAATGVVLASAVAGHFFAWHVDGIAGVLVAALILRAGWSAMREVIDPLLGRPADPALVRAIQETVLARPEVLGVHSLVIHDYGPGRCMVSLHAEVPAQSNFAAIHDVIDSIEQELCEKFSADAVVIHMDPIPTEE